MDGWNTTFLLGMPIFRGYVSFREGNWKMTSKYHVRIGVSLNPQTSPEVNGFQPGSFHTYPHVRYDWRIVDV